MLTSMTGKHMCPRVKHSGAIEAALVKHDNNMKDSLVVD